MREVPILLVPPMINKFYIMDLAPERSHIEHLVQSGQEVFTISWRNPREEQRDWGLDAYADAVVEAFDAVLDISGCNRAHVVGYCAGGLVGTATISHLAAVGRLEQVASMTLGVCVIDNEHSNVVGAFATEEIKNVAAAASAKKGYLDGRDLASVFLWLRPNDLIWPYVVNNWLLGKDPPAFDILYWNADTTRMPAALHRDFLEIATANSLRRPGGVTVLGSPVDLGKITVDCYLMAGAADHISPWQNCYRTTQLLGGRTRFVLSTSGHITRSQSARQQTCHLPNRRRADTVRLCAVGSARDHDSGNVVDGLGRVARRTLGRDAPRAHAAPRIRARQLSRRGTRAVRARAVTRRVARAGGPCSDQVPSRLARGTLPPARPTAPPPPGGRGGRRPCHLRAGRAASAWPGSAR